MARPSKPSVKAGSFKEKSAAKKALRTAGMRAQAGSGMRTAREKTFDERMSEAYANDKAGIKANIQNYTSTKRLESQESSMANAKKKATAAGLSPKSVAKNVAKGMKATQKRMTANTKKAKSMGRTYSNTGRNNKGL